MTQIIRIKERISNIPKYLLICKQNYTGTIMI